ncbi:hypothetical protein L9F63_027591, partial [Diploptera punctata]
RRGRKKQELSKRVLQFATTDIISLLNALTMFLLYVTQFIPDCQSAHIVCNLHAEERKICDSDRIYNFKHFSIFYIRNYTIFEHSDSLG